METKFYRARYTQKDGTEKASVFIESCMDKAQAHARNIYGDSLKSVTEYDTLPQALYDD